MSMAKILAAPLILAPWITERPTAPKPKTATLLPPSTFSVFQAAPRPVETPQPSSEQTSRGAVSETLAHEMSATTVYSEKVEQPMKCLISLPAASVNRLVPSGITPLPWVPRIFGQRLVRFPRGGKQKMQSGSPHCGV
eukprot:Skav205839  [mRNA]  locus=scaffold160:424215:428029:- [translate_table: standard]